jgi:hypothetical protein
VSAVEWTPEQAALVARVTGRPTAPVSDGERRCKDCGAVKPLDQFPSTGKGGRRLECKPCHSARRLPSAKARMRALGRLQLAHPAEFDVLYAEELAKARVGA